MVKLELKQQPRGNAYTVSKSAALAVTSGDGTAKAVSIGLTKRKVLDQDSWLPDADTSSVLHAGPCFGKHEQVSR